MHLPIHSTNISLPPPVIYGGTPITYSTKVLMTPISHSRITYPKLLIQCITIHIEKTNQKIYFDRHSQTNCFSYILPIFDYCNLLFLYLQSHQITRLQTLKNSNVRCVFFKMNHFSHDITSHLLI